MTNIILKAVQEGSENRDRIEFMKMWLDKIVVKDCLLYTSDAADE